MALVFNNWNHCIGYCLGVINNNGVNINQYQIQRLYDFEKVDKGLRHLERLNIIKIEGWMEDDIVRYCKKGNIEDLLNKIRYVNKKIEEFNNGQITFDIVLLAIQNSFYTNIAYVDSFLVYEHVGTMVFPSKVRALEVKQYTERIYTISDVDNNYRNKYGLYFIYNSKDELSYIGKSIKCIRKRCFQSLKERKLLDFSKIEFRETKSKSDVAIYESYYISKYKPPLNDDLKYDDEVTIELPNLQVSYEICRNNNGDYCESTYVAYKTKSMDVNEYLAKKNKTAFLNTKSNVESLRVKGVYDYETAKHKAILSCEEIMKQNNLYDTSELMWL